MVDKVIQNERGKDMVWHKLTVAHLKNEGQTLVQKKIIPITTYHWSKQLYGTSAQNMHGAARFIKFSVNRVPGYCLKG